MAARLNLKHQADIRAKIQSSQLINVLQQHIFNGRELKKSQVSAAIALLRKTVPDLSQVQGTMSNVNYDASQLSDSQLVAVIAGDAIDGGAGVVEEEEGESGSNSVHGIHTPAVSDGGPSQSDRGEVGADRSRND